MLPILSIDRIDHLVTVLLYDVLNQQQLTPSQSTRLNMRNSGSVQAVGGAGSTGSASLLEVSRTMALNPSMNVGAIN